MDDFSNFDYQLSFFREQLINKVKISENDVNCLASILSIEIKENRLEILEKIRKEHEKYIDMKTRYIELIAFQKMMDRLNNSAYGFPELVRAQVITQNYICFVYLKAGQNHTLN